MRDVRQLRDEIIKAADDSFPYVEKLINALNSIENEAIRNAMFGAVISMLLMETNLPMSEKIGTCDLVLLRYKIISVQRAEAFGHYVMYHDKQEESSRGVQ